MLALQGDVGQLRQKLEGLSRKADILDEESDHEPSKVIFEYKYFQERLDKTDSHLQIVCIDLLLGRKLLVLHRENLALHQLRTRLAADMVFITEFMGNNSL